MLPTVLLDIPTASTTSQKFPPQSPRLFWWILKHLDPLDAPVEVRIPDLYRGQYRLPWVYAPGPAQTTFVTAWERRHQEHWHIWQTYLSSAGFPDELDSTICSAVWLTMTKTVVTWGKAPEENLQFLWSAAIDAYEASGQVEYHHAISCIVGQTVHA